METEKEFLERLIDAINGTCVFWACPGPDEPFTPMATCVCCGSVIELRERLELIK